MLVLSSTCCIQRHKVTVSIAAHKSRPEPITAANLSLIQHIQGSKLRLLYFFFKCSVQMEEREETTSVMPAFEIVVLLQILEVVAAVEADGSFYGLAEDVSLWKLLMNDSRDVFHVARCH
jgi:hypothetical protein